jgi:PAS domain S-box-containing protein
LNAPDCPEIPEEDNTSLGLDADGASTTDRPLESRRVAVTSADRDRLLASLMEVPSAIAIVRGPAHVYEYANAAYRALTRLADPIGHPFGTSRSSTMAASMRATLDRVYATGESFAQREVATKLDREGLGDFQDAWFDIACQPIVADGTVEGVVIHATEVTPHVRGRLAAEAHAEQLLANRAALRATEERLRTLLACAPVLMVAVDTKGTIIFSEGEELARIGIQAGANVGKSFEETHAQATLIHANIRRALAGEAFTSIDEFRGQTFETRMRPLRAPGGAITGALGVATNVTQRVQAERERERLQSQILQAQKL